MLALDLCLEHAMIQCVSYVGMCRGGWRSNGCARVVWPPAAWFYFSLGYRLCGLLILTNDLTVILLSYFFN